MNKIAIYLDSLHDDPIEACALAASMGFANVCLRRVWATNIARATDEACQKLSAAINKHKLRVLMVCTDDGAVPAHELGSPSLINDLKRSCTIAAYFRGQFVAAQYGLHSRMADPKTVSVIIAAWTAAVSAAFAPSGIRPLVELVPDSYHMEPGRLGQLLSGPHQPRLLYDPAAIVCRRRVSPTDAYWSAFGAMAPVVDVHDYKIGVGFVAAGQGDCDLGRVVKEADKSTWFAVEIDRVRRASVSDIRTIVHDNLSILSAGRQQKH